MTIKTLSFHIKKNHPDYLIAQKHCEQSRILRNGINSIFRSSYSYYISGESADLTIPANYGLSDDIRKGTIKTNLQSGEKIRKIVQKHQKVDLPQKVSQSCLRSLLNSWKSFYSIRRNGIYAKPPKYSAKYHVAEYNPQAISKKALKRGYIIPTGWSQGFKIPDGYSHIKSARVVPIGCGFELKVLYEDTHCNKNLNSKIGIVAGIDPGINNLLTLAFSDFSEGIIVDGKPLKRINNHYNHVISQLASRLDIERNNKSRKLNHGLKKNDNDYVSIPKIKSQRLDKLWIKRNRMMKQYYTTATNIIVDKLCKVGVEKVVIGWNEKIKQNSHMGKRNNRYFVQIPTKKILENLGYKLQEKGIEVVWMEESYTSKSSFLDNDELPTRGSEGKYTFSGKRVKRGLYKTEKGIYINSDLNGAYNIIRKHDPHFRYSEIDVASDSKVSVGTGTVACQVRRVSFAY